MDQYSTNFDRWRDLGLSVRAANLLCNLMCSTVDDIRALGQSEVRKTHGMGPPTFNEIATLMGWPLVNVPKRKPKRNVKKLTPEPASEPPVATFNHSQNDNVADDDVAIEVDDAIVEKVVTIIQHHKRRE